VWVTRTRVNAVTDDAREAETRSLTVRHGRKAIAVAASHAVADLRHALVAPGWPVARVAAQP